MMRKSFKIIAIILILNLIITNKTYALTDVPISYDHGYSGSSGGPGSSGPPKPNGTFETTGTDRDGLTHRYKCEYYYSTSASTNIKVNTYDMNGQSLMSGSTIVNKEFKSGTWIGLWNSEYKKVTWSVNQSTLKCYEVVYSYDCEYSYESTTSTTSTYGCPRGTTYDRAECSLTCQKDKISFHSFTSNGKCYCKCRKTTSTTTTNNYNVSYSNKPTVNCPAYNNGNKLHDTKNVKLETIEINDAGILEQAREDAKAKAKDAALSRMGSPIGNVTFLRESTKNGVTSTSEEALPSQKLYDSPKYTDGTWAGYYEQWFIFEPDIVCMNIITGTVEYRNGNRCDDKEVEIPKATGSDGNKYWKYFIPLATTTGEKFYIRLGKNNSNTKLSEGECRGVMKEYPLEDDYLHYIESLSATPLEGIKTEDEETINAANGCIKKGSGRISIQECKNIMDSHQMNNDYTHYITSLGNFTFSNKKSEESKNISDISSNNGCRFAVTINYNIKQKFYGEQKKDSKNHLKGYGLFFRQIDINNPFPNKTNTTNRDSYWFGFDTTKLAFGNTTYIANLSTKENIERVKNYNKTYQYTQWLPDKENDSTIYGMNQNGTSYFIEKNSNIFERIAGKDYYKIGCGPNHKGRSGC